MRPTLQEGQDRVVPQYPWEIAVLVGGFSDECCSDLADRMTIYDKNEVRFAFKMEWKRPPDGKIKHIPSPFS